MRVRPFALPSTANNETPLLVRAPTIIKLAVAPSITNILVPVIFQSLPDPSAFVVMPFSSHLPDGSVVARLQREIAGTNRGAFITPHGIAVDSHGDIYIGECAFGQWHTLFPGEAPPPLLASLKKLVKIE